MMLTARNEGGETVGSTVHAFERAGLGKAPFRFDYYEVRKFQACQGAPVQAGTCCDYCGTGIMGVYWIKGSDGRRFKVGCDCVRKTGDAGLIRFVDAAARKVACAAAHARQDAKIAAGQELAATLEAPLRGAPHPYKWQADKGRTAWDYVQYMFANAGRKGKCEAAKFVTAFAAKAVAA